ncbi:unnamed protein product [Cylindrotheca closterium]|uniref:rRNA-processing protein EFG1 n=1 Tax=Cylindrotheca closterium TaxID=2856 RepID=A0AAD2CJV0_9STRA|nr:unnamed protein product [Cylindrotheca closterium]
MTKAPTKHGLERKFKSWRKGKSKFSSKKGSLKKQLRGHERLLSKLPEDEDDRRKELQKKIHDLKLEIGEKEQHLQEKKHAERSHGQKFLDRQRLVRKEKQERNGKSRKDELYKLALDQVYVAHHPNDVKYMPLYQKGSRVVDQSRQLYRRAVTRKRILKLLSSSSAPGRCNWIPKDQYARLPKDWTIQDEEKIFGGSISRKDIKQKKEQGTDDSRFVVASNHDALLQAAEQAETELNKEEEADDNKSVEVKSSVKSVGDSSSSSDSSSDDEEDAEAKQTETAHPVQSDTSSDDSDSDSSSSDDDSDDENIQKKPDLSLQRLIPNKEVDDEEEDDFLLDDNADEKKDGGNVFQNTAAQLPALGQRGDKSKGWETQRQRPGQYKKQRVRR